MKNKLTNIIKSIILILIGFTISYFGTLENLLPVIEEKIVPVVVGLVGAISTLYSFFAPTLNELNTSNKTMINYIDGANKLIANNNQLKAEIENALKEMENLQKNVENLTKIVKIGFLADESLVENGTANAIFKVGDSNEI